MRFPGQKLGAAAILILVNQMAGSLVLQANTCAGDGGLSTGSPESAGMASDRLAKIDSAVQETIDLGEIPGAVILIGRQGRVVYHKAFGYKAVEPRREAMSLDTVFDMASLTKDVATATSMMILVERGKISLVEAVASYSPAFRRIGKEQVTVEQLHTHRAGLPPDNEIADYIGKTVDPLENIYNLRPGYTPGTRFSYSDVGYIVAAEIIRRVSGERLDQFAVENIFRPLGMNSSRFLPISDE